MSWGPTVSSLVSRPQPWITVTFIASPLLVLGQAAKLSSLNMPQPLKEVGYWLTYKTSSTAKHLLIACSIGMMRSGKKNYRLGRDHGNIWEWIWAERMQWTYVEHVPLRALQCLVCSLWRTTKELPSHFIRLRRWFSGGRSLQDTDFLTNNTPCLQSISQLYTWKSWSGFQEL